MGCGVGTEVGMKKIKGQSKGLLFFFFLSCDEDISTHPHPHLCTQACTHS